MFIGVLESVTGSYIDPLVGGGFGSIASFIVSIIVLFVRPYGLLGKANVERV
jgi:branched-chain amino acid transport system permease protein